MDIEKLNRAISLRDAGHPEDALKLFAELLSTAREPDEVVTLKLNEAACWTAVAHVDEAEECLRAAESLTGKVESNTSLIILLQKAGLAALRGEFKQALDKYDEARRVYHDCLERRENRDIKHDIMTRRAVSLVNLGRYAEAIPELQKAVAHETERSSKSDIEANLALSFFHENENALARDAFLRAEALGITEQWRAAVPYYLGLVLLRMGHVEQAEKYLIRCFEEVLAGTPGPPKDYICQALTSVYRLKREPIPEHLRLRMAKPS